MMRASIWRTLAFVGFFLFASFQLLPLTISIGLGFELFPHWPLLAVGVGLLLYGGCLGGILWFERSALFHAGEKRAERLSNWLITLGLNAIGESLFLFFFQMIVMQPLASWLNGTFSMDELLISFLFLLAGAAGGMVLTIFFWLSAQSGKSASKKE